MTRVGTRQLKNRLSRYVKRAEAGEQILITIRGRVAAKLIPAESINGEMTFEEKLKRLAAQGHIRLSSGKRTATIFRPVRVKGKPISRMIIEDRR